MMPVVIFNLHSGFLNVFFRATQLLCAHPPAPPQTGRGAPTPSEQEEQEGRALRGAAPVRGSNSPGHSPPALHPSGCPAPAVPEELGPSAPAETGAGLRGGCAEDARRMRGVRGCPRA